MSNHEEVFQVLKELVVLRRVLRRGVAGQEGPPRLSVMQAQAILHVAEHGAMSMRHLAEQLGISQPAATDLVNRLVEAGTLERFMVPNDRRKVMVRLTPAARETAEGTLAERRALIAGALTRLSPEERRGFLRGLRLLAESLAGLVGSCSADETISAGVQLFAAASRQ